MSCDDRLRAWAADITAGKDVTVLLPVFDQVAGTGASANYKLMSFAAFKVKGWRFSGNNVPRSRSTTSLPPSTLALTCDGSCRGIIGSFVQYVSLADGYTLGTAGGLRRRHRPAHAIAPNVATPSTNQFRSSF